MYKVLKKYFYFAYIILGLFSQAAHALEIDEKLTLRVLSVSESKKTFLINRGLEDGLVVDDYYKRGLEINRKLDRDRAANKYDLVANVQVSEGQNLINVRFDANDEFVTPAKITLRFLHPTIKGQDQVLVLQAIAKGIFAGALPSLIYGNWYLQIEADDWRLLEEIFIGH